MEAISPNRRWNISAESAEDGTYKRYSRYNQNSELSLCLIPCPNGALPMPGQMRNTPSSPLIRIQNAMISQIRVKLPGWLKSRSCMVITPQPVARTTTFFK